MAAKNVIYILSLYVISTKGPGRKQKAHSHLENSWGFLTKGLIAKVWLNVGDP